MKQILQNLASGETILAELPRPSIDCGTVLIQSQASVISLGTEKMLIDFGKAGWLEKARKQPEKVRQVLNKLKTDGLFPTINAVRAKLDQPLPLGYSNAGVVVEIGEGAEGFKPGDRVVSNGPHAEWVVAPQRLCAKIPDGVEFEEAAFTAVGSIGLQGVRLLKPMIGEYVVVVGLGLIGLLVVQILQANGCQVMGVDFDERKCRLAEELGAVCVHLSKEADPVSAAMKLTGNRGVDGVVISASTLTSDPIHQAALMCRKRGRIVMIGVTGMELSRADFYEKELSFQVSCSYGPGRYDREYEERGRDYPYDFVRWTEERNFHAFLGLLQAGKVNVRSLISHRYDFADALIGYQAVGDGNALGIILNYPETDRESAATENASRVVSLPTGGGRREGTPVVGFIGPGNFAAQILLPALAKSGVCLKTIASRTGVSGTHLGKKFDFERSTTEIDEIIDDPKIDAVFISTRPNSHSSLVKRALEAGKAVYVEKPLCLKLNELDAIMAVQNRYADKNPFVMVGFNRRFAPQVVKMKQLLDTTTAPKSFIITVNAGEILPGSWMQDPEVNGPRFISEGCHFVDLLRHLAGCTITDCGGVRLQQEGAITDDKTSVWLRFEDGSFGTIHYLANGHKAFAKERLEVFCAGKVLQLDNFRKLTGHGWSSFSKMNMRSQDKGHEAEIAAVVDCLRKGQQPPIPFEEIEEVSRWTIDAYQQTV